MTVQYDFYSTRVNDQIDFSISRKCKRTTEKQHDRCKCSNKKKIKGKVTSLFGIKRTLHLHQLDQLL